MVSEITEKDITAIKDFEKAIHFCQRAGINRLDEVVAFCQVAANEGITVVEATGVDDAADNKCLRLRYIFRRLSRGIPSKNQPGLRLLLVKQDAKNTGKGAPHDTYSLAAKGKRLFHEIAEIQRHIG